MVLLGLRVVAPAVEKHTCGSSVVFIAGAQERHRHLEKPNTLRVLALKRESLDKSSQTRSPVSAEKRLRFTGVLMTTRLALPCGLVVAK